MLRLVSYNVHRCLGVDGLLSPGRIAEVIASVSPDIVALQELDVGRARTGKVDQALAIARELKMHMHFHPAQQVMEERYGDAVLSTRPARLVRAGALPSWRFRQLEPRGALWVEIEVDGTPLQVINTHLSLVGPEQLIQIEALFGPDWLGSAAARPPLILAGDMNAVPLSRPYRRLAARLADAQLTARPSRPRRTFPSRAPLIRIDHVFVSEGVRVSRCDTVRSELAQRASDHLPLVVDFEIASPPFALP